MHTTQNQSWSYAMKADWLPASQNELTNQVKWLLCWRQCSPSICEENVLRRSLFLLSSTEEYLLDLTFCLHLPSEQVLLALCNALR